MPGLVLDDALHDESDGTQLELEPVSTSAERRARRAAEAAAKIRPEQDAAVVPIGGRAGPHPARSAADRREPGAAAAGRAFWLKSAAGLGALCLLALLTYHCDTVIRWLAPAPATIVKRIDIRPDSDHLVYDGEIYAASWTKGARLEGWVRRRATPYSPELPFLTHELLIVTGDYADPAKVEISEIEDHKASWRAATQPAGTLQLAHLIPTSLPALDGLSRAVPGSWVTIHGDALKGPLHNPAGEQLWRTSGSHPTLRVHRITVSSGPPAKPPESTGGGEPD